MLTPVARARTPSAGSIAFAGADRRLDEGRRGGDGDDRAGAAGRDRRDRTTRRRGVVVSIGHTDADAVAWPTRSVAGATAVTHLFNAMAPFGHRDPGPIGVTLADDSLIAGLICDGIHVDPLAVRIAWRALGPVALMLVTDATAVLGVEPGVRRLGDVDIDVSAAGVRTPTAHWRAAISRSIRPCATSSRSPGARAADAVATVTTTPARLLGSTTAARSRPAGAADVIVLDTAICMSSPRSSAVSLAHVVAEEAWRWRS